MSTFLEVSVAYVLKGIFYCIIGGLSNSKVLNLESEIESQMHKKDSTFKMNLKV